jgi:hypothetical protein
MLKGMRSSMILHGMEESLIWGVELITADLQAGTREYHDEYDWLAGMENDGGLCPSEIFTGPYGVDQSQRAMASYDACAWHEELLCLDELFRDITIFFASYMTAHLPTEESYAMHSYETQLKSRREQISPCVAERAQFHFGTHASM